jgi:hypothetical protein
MSENGIPLKRIERPKRATTGGGGEEREKLEGNWSRRNIEATT